MLDISHTPPTSGKLKHYMDSSRQAFSHLGEISSPQLELALFEGNSLVSYVSYMSCTCSPGLSYRRVAHLHIFSKLDIICLFGGAPRQCPRTSTAFHGYFHGNTHGDLRGKPRCTTERPTGLSTERSTDTSTAAPAERPRTCPRKDPRTRPRELPWACPWVFPRTCPWVFPRALP